MPRPLIGDQEPVDGFTVEVAGDQVLVTFSNRYGHADQVVLDRPDAWRLGQALVFVSGGPAGTGGPDR